MTVTIDQAREHGVAAEVDDLNAGGKRSGGGLNGLDLSELDQHHLVPADLAAIDVYQSAGPYGEPVLGGNERRRNRSRRPQHEMWDQP